VPITESMESSWLIRDGMDRERMLDMDGRLQPVRRRSFAVLALALIACGPWLGWWTLAPLAVAGVLFGLADKYMAGMRRPEYLMFAAWAGSEVIIAVSCALTGGPTVATMSWLAIPIVTLASRFSDRGIAVGVATALGLLLAVGFGVDAQAVLHDPTLVIAPAALIGAITMLSIALMQSDVEHRSRAVIDELTGMLNRTALAMRVEELAQQSALTGDPVGVVVADIDRFKQINDVHGHGKGDAVLRDIAYLMRKELRAFDLAYRLGGEEFLVLLPGADLGQATAVAEQLREAVEGETLGGEIDVTISCGVGASSPGSRFEYETVFTAADAALYEAKRSGRNRVCDGNAAAVAVPA
jgi:diguanylate cyclase (GGDEF)-like protein